MKVKCKRILILDPNMMDVYRLFSDLIRNGFMVETCCNIKEAVEKIRDIKFDCIVMDVNLPKIKGYDAVSILKVIDPDIKIIMTAQKNDMALEAEVRKQDITYYHIKSFDPQDLLGAIRDLCRK